MVDFEPAAAAAVSTRVGPGAGPLSPWAAMSRLSTLDRVPVAGLLRVSQVRLQDVRGSLQRQVEACVAALPASWEIVAWYIDVESGRMELDDRSQSDNHLLVDLPVQRAGGLRELLDESRRRDCRFAAVICENAERVFRITYFGTQVEHILAKADIEVFATDEGIKTDGKKAARVLMRRVKQAIGEFYALNVFEQAWDGMRIHSREGFNLGPVPYGYVAVKEPHPAPARRARGLTKTRLDVDPVRGPAVTEMFRLRVVERRRYQEIADLLNTDLDRYPVPTPIGPFVSVGVWTWPAVRRILENPKYTGHMVWNRTTTRVGMTVQRKRRRKLNPTDQWVWSPEPTHPVLVCLDRYRQAQHRTDQQGSAPPAARDSRYQLRGRVRCGYCGRRMTGTLRGGRAYYRCLGPRNALGKPTRTDHPASLYIREDALLPAVCHTITERVFSPDRRAWLDTQRSAQPRHQAETHARAIDATRRRLADLDAQQDVLMAELRATATDPTKARYRDRIRHQSTQLDTEYGRLETELTELQATQPVIDNGDPAILDAMPLGLTELHRLPGQLLGRLLDTLQLVIRVDNPTTAHIKITLTGDTPAATAEAAAETNPDDNPNRQESGTALHATRAALCHQDCEEPDPDAKRGAPLPGRRRDR